MRFQRCLSCMSRSNRWSIHNFRQPDRESRALAGLALDRDVSAHHLAEAFADREPEAGWRPPAPSAKTPGLTGGGQWFLPLRAWGAKNYFLAHDDKNPSRADLFCIWGKVSRKLNPSARRAISASEIRTGIRYSNWPPHKSSAKNRCRRANSIRGWFGWSTAATARCRRHFAFVPGADISPNFQSPDERK
jgi:hypothetical protein